MLSWSPKRIKPTHVMINRAWMMRKQPECYQGPDIFDAASMRVHLNVERIQTMVAQRIYAPFAAVLRSPYNKWSSRVMSGVMIYCMDGAVLI